MPPLLERVFDRLDEHLCHLVEPGQLDGLHGRLVAAFVGCATTVRTRGHASGELLFAALMAEFAVAVDDHPERVRVLAAGAEALHRALKDESVPSADGWTAGVDERRDLAREVHDWVGSGVALALYQLDLFAVAAARGEPTSADRVSDARRTLEELQQCTRRLVSQLQDRSWVTGLEVDIQEFASRANVLGARTTVVVRGDEESLAPRVRDEVFAVLREALRNAYTHACAEQVTAVVDITPQAVRASVDDDGVGLGTRPRTGRGGGLAVMRERAQALGGTLEITATRPRGTRVDLHVDLTGSAS
ncbi:sensor histidine kinase [Pseudonocardia sp. MH-G8]|uniref:sensor histidine kinase n=1 Tax=Pseudonocardia sp. MH-G8 TaxID=1854588 RepID=UPI00130466A7|nr:histidine kinase [Pseudonocardia sp. MH-G8]